MEGEGWWGWGWPNDVGSIDIDLSRFSFAAGFLMTTHGCLSAGRGTFIAWSSRMYQFAFNSLNLSNQI